MAGRVRPKGKAPTQKGGQWLVVPGLLLLGMALAKGINIGSFVVADWVYPLVGALDPQKAYLYITLHHFVQLLVTLGIMLVVVRAHAKVDWATFGFTGHRWRSSLWAVVLFCTGWTVVQAGIGYWLVSTGTPADVGFDLTPANLAGRLGFQLFLSGTSEEVLFRGLMMTGFALVWAPRFKSRSVLGVAVVLASTLVFMFDHVNFAFSPFRITHFEILQQGTLLVFGLFYGILFWRTGSLLGPIVAHGMLNAIITGVGIWLQVWVA